MRNNGTHFEVFKSSCLLLKEEISQETCRGIERSNEFCHRETAASSFHGNKRIAHLKGKCNQSVKYVNDVLYGRTFSKSKL